LAFFEQSITQHIMVCLPMNTSPNYYEVLGIPVDATSRQIKAAFKKLALQYHPDVYKGVDAHERMRILLQAYQTLSDPAARRQYDIQHSKYGTACESFPSAYERNTSSIVTRDAVRARAQEISARARRDRQRYYDFPGFPVGQSVHIDLIDIAYTLVPQQARELVQQGMLRGNAPTTERQTYFCHRCHHRWEEQSSMDDLPSNCPKCQATDWAEFLLLRCLHCRAVFESEQIRHEIGLHRYGRRARRAAADLCQPYELFPLCPYCGSARWSPAEEARRGELQLHIARRSTRLRLVGICVALIVLLVVGAVILGVVR
jgi:curved DNA-binding protein CbpA